VVSFHLDLRSDPSGPAASVEFRVSRLAGGRLVVQLTATNHGQEEGVVATATGTSAQAAAALLAGLQTSLAPAHPIIAGPARFEVSTEGGPVRLHVEDAVSAVSLEVGSREQAQALVQGMSAALAWAGGRDLP
jgi:hypothetical protein